MNSAFPMLVFDTTPPATPASSPLLFENTAPWIITGLPSHFTVELPCDVSLLMAMLGYGMGIGPAGEGVLHTSGKPMTIPLEDEWTTVRMLTFTDAGMADYPRWSVTSAAARWPEVDAVRTRSMPPSP